MTHGSLCPDEMERALFVRLNQCLIRKDNYKKTVKSAIKWRFIAGAAAVGKPDI